MAHQRPLSVWQLLEWADAHNVRTGKYPDLTSGRVWEAPHEKWLNIDANLRSGHRGLPGGWSLAQMLDAFRGKRNIQDLPHHTIEEILAWADAHHTRTGRWPSFTSGAVAGAPGESWPAVDTALHAGVRGLPGGMSLARLLRDRRGVSNKRCGPRRQKAAIPRPKRRRTSRSQTKFRALVARHSLGPRQRRDLLGLSMLTVESILAWADEFFVRFGRWPRRGDGLVEGTCGETWVAIDIALRRGHRGVPAGSSIARLLAEHRGLRTPSALPPLSVEQILDWAKAHHARSGDWPSISSGPIAEAPGETWNSIQHALRAGRRGLPNGGSLGHLLDAHFGTHRGLNNTPLTEREILAWADAWHQWHGTWPTAERGEIPESEGDTWRAISAALRHGGRGLPGGVSLAQLLAARRGVRNLSDVPPLTEEQILAWADAHFRRHRKYPTQRSGAVEDAPGEAWGAIRVSLILGQRGLPGGKSLAQFLADRRGVRNRLAQPPLTHGQILAWADAYHTRHGKWPTVGSGPIPESPELTWGALNVLMRGGCRGLPRGSSLARLLAEQRGKRNRGALPPLTDEQILAWADAHHARYGRWPTLKSGPTTDSPGDTWMAVHQALVQGYRGLPGGSSLAKLLDRYRRKVLESVTCAEVVGGSMSPRPDSSNGATTGASAVTTRRKTATSNGPPGRIRPR